MKKLVAFVAVAVAAVTMAVADPLLVVHGNFNFLNLGTTFEKDIKDIKDSADAKDSFNFSIGGGVGINIPFGGYFGFQPGVDFYYNTIGIEKDKDSISYSYSSLEIPLLFTIKYNKFNFALGPYAAFQLGGKYISKNEDSKHEFTIKDADVFNIGLEVRAGYEERIGMGMVVASVGYKLDFLPYKGKVSENGEKIGLGTRRGLTVDVGYKIPLSIFGL